MFYGIKRQPDGSYAEPFYVAFDDANDAKWGSSSIVLGKDLSASSVGKIVAAGEPPLATIGGTQYLYIVYVWVRGFEGGTGLTDLDMQAGFVKHR